MTERDERRTVGAGGAGRAEGGAEALDVARTLWASKGLVAACLALALAAAAAWLLVAPPVYRSEAVIRIDDRRGLLHALDGVQTALDAAPAQTEIEMLRARSLVAETVDALALDVEVTPRAGPLAARAAARLPRALLPAVRRLGFPVAAEDARVRISRLDVPDALVGARLVLRAGEGGAWRLETEGGEVLAAGTAGTPRTAGDGEVAMDVAELAAPAGTEFAVVKRRRSEVISAVQAALAVGERGKDTGVVGLRLEGEDPGRVAAALETLVRIYLRDNAERASVRAQRTLAFLDERLPELRAAVDRAEAALHGYQLKNGTVDISIEAKALLDRTGEIEHRIADLEAQRRELVRQRMTERHPAVGEVDDKMSALQATRAQLDARLRMLPGVELRLARLTRDVQAATALYLQVQETAQQVRIAAAGTLGSATLVDAAAVPERPVSPQPVPALALACVLGCALGVAAAAVRKRLEGAGDPADVEAATGFPVLGTLPRTSTEGSLARVIGRKIAGKGPVPLSAVNPGDPALEELRALRTNVQSALRRTQSNVVAIVGPTPDVGKSFVCVNLSLLLASERRRVLLVDADLRRGAIHREFGLPRGPGLAEVLAGEATLAAAARPTATAHLEVLAAGEPPEDPAALLEGSALADLLAEAGKRYDVVVVDTPAILAVTDPALVARHAGLTVMVLRAGRHPVHEIALAVQRLSLAGAKVSGTILNDVRSTRYGRYGRYRRYAYPRVKAVKAGA